MRGHAPRLVGAAGGISSIGMSRVFLAAAKPINEKLDLVGRKAVVGKWNIGLLICFRNAPYRLKIQKRPSFAKRGVLEPEALKS